MKLKKAIAALSVLALVGSMAGCGKKKVEEEPPKEPEVKKEVRMEEPEPEEVEGEPVEVKEEEIPANQNLLTGLADLTEGAIGKRPVAVMVNNIQAAMPQYGIAQADIIFEIPVEADQTRFMALYGDYTQVPKICPIRSCRYYYPAVSQGFDAFYVNWGCDETILDYIASLNLDQIEGLANTGGLFGRDQGKLNSGYSLEHTGTFDGPGLPGYIESKGLRTDLAEDKKGTAFQFNGMDEQVKPEGNDCTQAALHFGAQSSEFVYDAEKQVYLKSMNGNPQIDGITQEQLSFTNVFVLETDISLREGDPKGRKKVDWAGSTDTTGYYVSNGAVQKIHWSKEGGSEKGYLKFFDEAGNELKINRGKSYIAFNYKDKTTFQ